MTFSVQYRVNGVDPWYEYQNTNDPKEAKKLQKELKTIFKTRIVKE